MRQINVPAAPAPEASVDREIVLRTFIVKTAFTGASIGDQVTAARVLDLSGETPTQVGATVWFNETTALALASAPSAANLDLLSSTALTDAQLRAAPLSIFATTSAGEDVPLLATENGALAVGNANRKFRDGFVTASPDLTIWDEAWTNRGDGIVNRGGDAAGSSYLRISMDPTQVDSEYVLTTKDRFVLPSRFIFGLSQTHRFLGHEIEVGFVGVDGSGNIEVNAAFADVAISGTITIASNVATINFSSALHGIKGGDRVLLVGNAENRLNVGPVVATIVTPTQITVPCTLANGTYTAGGVVRWADPAKMARNACGLLFENATVTNATFYTRRNGSSGRLLNSTTASTTGTQSNTSPYSDAFNSAAAHELIGSMQEFMFISKAADGIAAASGQGRWSQGVPDEEKEYKLRIRARALSNVTRPIAKIVSATKLTASTTTNIVTDVAHNLIVGSWVAISGVRDIVNFPNTAAAAVLSIVSPTEFTIAMAGTTAIASAGGAVILVQGSVVLSGLTGLAVQSIARAGNILTVTVNTTATSALPGEYWHLYGCDATSLGLYDGPYKVLRMTGSAYELESVGADFGSINCGGALFRRTDHRVHFVQELEYTRHIVELFNQHGSADAARAMPVAVTNAPAIASNSSVNVAQVGAGTLAAHSAALAGTPLPIGGRVSTAPDVSLAALDSAFALITTAQQMVVKEFSTAENDLNITAPLNGTITNSTTPVVVAAAPGASLHNYYTCIVLNSDALGTATEFVLRDVALTLTTSALASNTLVTSAVHGLTVNDPVVFVGVSGITGLTAGVTYYVLTTASTTTFTLAATPGGATLTVTGTPAASQTLNHIIFRTKIQTAGLLTPLVLPFRTPLRGGIAVAQEVVTLTASTTGAVYFAAQGYRSF